MQPPIDGAASSSCRLRASTPGDDEALLQWITSAADLRLFTGHVMTWPLTRAQLEHVSGTPGREAHTLVGREHDEPLGRVEVTVTGDAARLSRVIVAPAQRGRGLAHVLIRLALQRARARGAHRVGLHVIAGNDPAVRTYERLGFQRDVRAEPREGILALTRSLRPTADHDARSAGAGASVD